MERGTTECQGRALYCPERRPMRYVDIERITREEEETAAWCEAHGIAYTREDPNVIAEGIDRETRTEELRVILFPGDL